MTDRPQSFIETPSDLDFHQLLLPKDTSNVPRPREATDDDSGPSSDAGSFFVPEPLSRSNSVYSFSRASLSSQLASLTSMSLPQAESLAANIRALPTAKKAIKALNNAAEQIMSWTKKALKVLKNLDADDDVEWAAEAGRDALHDVEKTINQFEHLISVYVLSIEELQSRNDISEIRHEDLAIVVEQMEITLDSWENVRQSLKRIHIQVEMAMEWEELWNTVLADVGTELDGLSQLVFEMEEKRHRAYTEQTAPAEPSRDINLNELESFMEDPTSKKKKEIANARFSMTFEASPLDSPTIESNQDDSDLLALFARMQPLRASLDFLPMRLSMFQQRAEAYFPNACKELDDKKDRLENSWAQLSDEAETLRRELSEDRWIAVFRNAGRQAQKMLDSVERSIGKVQEAIDEGYQRTNPPGLAKRIESFEAKKMHYMPAVQRVLSIIQKGLKDRLTVNGEILRLNRDLSSKSRDLEDAMNSLARQLEPVTPRHNQRLRESISSIISADRSFSSTTFAGTPGSSPASSIDLTPNNNGRPVSKYGMNGYSKPRATSTNRGPPLSSTNRRASMQPLRPTTPSYGRRGVSPAPPSVYRQGHYKPPTAQLAPRPASTVPGDKPRWSAVISTTDVEKSSGYQRLSVGTTPSAQRKFSPRSFSSSTAIPLRSPLSREATASPQPGSDHNGLHLKSFAERVASPSPARSGLMEPVPYHKSRNIGNPSAGTIRAPSSLAVRSGSRLGMSSGTSIPVRPPSSLANQARPGSALRGSYRPASRSALPLRSTAESSQKFPSRSPRSSLDSGRGRDVLAEQSSDDENEHYTEDDRSTEHGSAQGNSPLAKRVARSPSSLASSRGGKRQSMLPVPVGGRLSSIGHRNE